jgi:hypothetical protein
MQINQGEPNQLHTRRNMQPTRQTLTCNNETLAMNILASQITNMNKAAYKLMKT